MDELNGRRDTPFERDLAELLKDPEAKAEYDRTREELKVAIPCWNCGGELYDRVRKYQLDNGTWSKGSYCPHCNANQRADLTDEEAAAERTELFGPDAPALVRPSG